MCKYKITTPDGKEICSAYSKSKRKDKLIWLHYPDCENKNCPLEHVELLKGTTLTTSDK